jgi:RNA polymerase sigma-70 factor (ECF subfamily)
METREMGAMGENSTGPGLPSAYEGWAASSTRRLLERARDGDREALDRVFQRLLGSLRRWAHGRLPRWARDGVETADVVQQAAVKVLGRIPYFEPRHRHALRAYLRQAVRNEIRDQIRRVKAHGPAESLDELDLPRAAVQDESAIEAQQERMYVQGLTTLPRRDRELIVARLHLDYSYEQIAVMTGRPSKDSARMAVRRALLRLAETIRAELG